QQILFTSADSTIVTGDTANVCETDLVDSNPNVAGVQYDYNDNCTDLFLTSNPLAFSAKPTNLIISTTFSDQINLTWSPVSSVQGFKIEASYDNGTSWVTEGTIADGTATSYDLFALKCGVSALFRVSSYVDTPYPLTSPPTVAVTGKTIPCVKPTLQSPANKALLNTGSLSLRWSKPVPTISKYDVDLSTSATFTTHVAGFPQTAVTESLDVNALPSGTYYWKVRTSAPNVGTYSAVGSFTLDSSAPAINYGTNSTFTLTWNRITWASGYQLQIDNNNDFSSLEYQNAGLSGNNLELTISGIEDDTYYWRIRARDANGIWGQWSSPATFVLDSGHHYGS
ncbi:MAG: fibronectin type III domain-containing protein, partial [Chloroflexota bacterium]